MEAMAEAVAETIAACFEEKNKEIAMIRAGLEGYKLFEKLFREEEPAEKPEMSTLEELLFEQAYLAREKCKEVCSDIRYGRFLETQDLIRNAGLQEEYDAWKEEKGYE